MVPAALLHGSEVWGAAAAHALATRPAVVEGEAWPKFCTAHHTFSDHVIWYPVGWPGTVLQEVCKGKHAHLWEPIFGVGLPKQSIFTE